MSTVSPRISIVMPVYNAGVFLGPAIRSVIDQTFTDWELIVVNDGSIDDSSKTAGEYSNRDHRISVTEKENGGYVSARLHGLKYISPGSEFLLFFDADDILDPRMLSRLYEEISAYDEVGAVYCNHMLIDAEGKTLGLPEYGKRLVPTYSWVKVLDEREPVTPFISIFAWATKMIEPMTLIRKKAYEATGGWDERFGKGKGNIGDGVLLFSELALTWKVLYISEPLYLYRRHSQQSTASSHLNRLAKEKVLAIWEERIKEEYEFSRDIRAAIICCKYRFGAFETTRALKYFIRYKPWKVIPAIVSLVCDYLLSTRLFFYRKTKIFQR